MATSSLLMVPTPVSSRKVKDESCGSLVSTTLKASLASTVVSPLIVTAMVVDDEPGAMLPGALTIAT